MGYKFRWLDFKITNRCNNNCVYCGVENDPLSAPEKLPFNVIKNTLVDAMEENFNFICFLGGEPSILYDRNARSCIFFVEYFLFMARDRFHGVLDLF